MSKHFTNEQMVNGKWVKTGHNHLLDCAAMACVAADMIGFDYRRASLGTAVLESSNQGKR
jgi:hypothetical protein